MLALIKLTRHHKGRKIDFIDYISYDIAKLNIEVQGEKHNNKEWSTPDILKVHDYSKNTARNRNTKYRQ